MPDVLNPQQRHRCMSHIRSKATKPEMLVRKQFVLPKTNTDFWQTKIARNRERDRQNATLLRSNGWQVITLWACSLTKDKLENTMQQVSIALNYNFLKIIK